MQSVFARTEFWWRSGLVLLLAAGAYLHLSGYNRGLEFIGYGAWDDVRIYVEAYYQTHDLTEKMTLPGYPPGILAIDYAAYTLLHTQYGEAGRFYTVPGIHLVRFWAALANLGTALLLALIGRHLHSRAAGWLAAAIFLLMPNIIHYSVGAFSEAFQMTALMLCLYCAMLALKHDSPRFALLSCGAALLMIVLKYSAYPALAIPAGITLWAVWRGKRQQWLLTLLVQGCLIGVVGVWLIFAYDAPRMISMGAEADQFVRTNPLSLLGDGRWLDMIAQATSQLGLAPLVMLAVVGVGGTVYWHSAVAWQRLIYSGLCVLYIAWCILVLAYLRFSELAHRYLLPVSPVGALLLSLAVMSLIHWLRLKNRLLAGGAVVTIALFWLLPQAAQSYRRAYDLSLPSTRDAYIDWAQKRLPADGILLAPWQDRAYFTENDFTEFTGVAHDVIPESLMGRSRAELLNMGALYTYIDEPTLEQLQQMPEKADDLAHLLLLKQFPAPDDASAWRGSKIFIYRLTPMQFNADVVFGSQLRWIGYDLSATTLRPGETLTFTPYWQAIAQPDRDYSIFMRLMNDEAIVAQTAGQPARVPYPTSAWDDPSEIVIGQNFALFLPDDIVPGQYRLIMGIDVPQTGDTLPTSTGEHATLVATITVQP